MSARKKVLKTIRKEVRSKLNEEAVKVADQMRAENKKLKSVILFLLVCISALLCVIFFGGM